MKSFELFIFPSECKMFRWRIINNPVIIPPSQILGDKNFSTFHTAKEYKTSTKEEQKNQNHEEI